MTYDRDADIRLMNDSYHRDDNPLIGLDACQRLVEDNFAYARSNQLFYAQKLAYYGAVTYAELTPTVKPGWSRFNPSIATLPNGTLLVNVRSSNYEYRDGHYHYVSGRIGYIQTDNILAILELFGDRVETKVIRHFHSPDEEGGSQILGMEDVRLYVRGDGLYGSATACFDERMVRTLVETRLCGLRFVAGEGPYEVRLKPGKVLNLHPTHFEKNWTPIVDSSWQHDGWLYQWYPNVIKLDREGLLQDMGEPGKLQSARHLRGGTQAVAWDDCNWMALAHEVVWYPGSDKRIYLHRFVCVDRISLRVKALGRPFWFSPQDPLAVEWGVRPPRKDPTGHLPAGVEFAAGLAVSGGQVMVTFGVNDASAWIARMPRRTVLETFATGDMDS